MGDIANTLYNYNRQLAADANTPQYNPIAAGLQDITKGLQPLAERRMREEELARNEAMWQRDRGITLQDAASLRQHQFALQNDAQAQAKELQTGQQTFLDDQRRKADFQSTAQQTGRNFQEEYMVDKKMEAEKAVQQRKIADLYSAMKADMTPDEQSKVESMVADGNVYGADYLLASKKANIEELKRGVGERKAYFESIGGGGSWKPDYADPEKYNQALRDLSKQARTNLTLRLQELTTINKPRVDYIQKRVQEMVKGNPPLDVKTAMDYAVVEADSQPTLVATPEYKVKESSAVAAAKLLQDMEVKSGVMFDLVPARPAAAPDPTTNAGAVQPKTNLSLMDTATPTGGYVTADTSFAKGAPPTTSPPASSGLLVLVDQYPDVLRKSGSKDFNDPSNMRRSVGEDRTTALRVQKALLDRGVVYDGDLQDLYNQMVRGRQKPGIGGSLAQRAAEERARKAVVIPFEELLEEAKKFTVPVSSKKF